VPAHLRKGLSLRGLHDTDYTYRECALVSLAMYGRAVSPLFAAIWVDPDFTGGDNAPVRPRTFEPDWSEATIAAHAAEKRYPKLIGITAWEFEQPRSLLVYEQLSKRARGHSVVRFDAPSKIAGQFQRSVVTGLDMCVQRVAADNPFEKDAAKETYVAVIHPAPEQATMFNVQRLEPVKDKLDGLDSFSQHRAALRGWSRGHHAIPFTKNVTGGRRQVAVHYQDDTFKKWPDDITEEFRCGTPIEGPIKPSQIDSRIKKGEAKGYWPIRVGANGWGEHTRFFITWARKGKLFPLKRYDVVVDGIDPTNRRVMQGNGYAVTGSFEQASAVAVGPASSAAIGAPAQPVGGGGGDGFLIGPALHLADIDKLVFARMHELGAHTAQIAVAKDSKLKLARSYTFAERNWPVTNAHHRMRMGSIAKLLMGMRACAAGEDFLLTPIKDLLPALQLDIDFINALDRLENYTATRLIDLLRHQSGWDNSDADVYRGVLNRVQRVPLQPGDFSAYSSQSSLKFVEGPPATDELYNNVNFVAASEILAHHLGTGWADYVPLMLKYWSGSDGWSALRDLAGPLPPTREQCLADGEPPVRAVPGASRATAAKEVATATGWPPPWVPSTYRWCADAEFMVGAGYFTMSAVMLARILQGMCPAPIAPVKKLLTRAQRTLMLQTNQVSLDSVYSEGHGDHGAYGAGAASQTMNFAGNAGTRRISKDGRVIPAAGRSHVSHYVWGPSDAEHHLTLATVITGLGPVNSLQAPVEALEELGYWDSDVNLFPEFFGT
jgi:hypothetical protein